MTAPPSRAPYYRVFAALMALLGLTIAAALIPYERWGLARLGIAVALAIASLKAVLVAIWFMHLKHSSRLTRVFALAGVVWLGILFAITLADYLTRDWLPVSRGWVERVEAERED